MRRHFVAGAIIRSAAPMGQPCCCSGTRLLMFTGRSCVGRLAVPARRHAETRGGRPLRYRVGAGVRRVPQRQRLSGYSRLATTPERPRRPEPGSASMAPGTSSPPGSTPAPRRPACVRPANPRADPGPPRSRSHRRRRTPNRSHSPSAPTATPGQDGNPGRHRGEGCLDRVAVRFEG
jgi:hypothetical protein